LQLRVDRGPNWLFVKLRPNEVCTEEIPPKVADELWSISTRHFIYRLVLEMEEFDSLPRGLLGQLVMLQERLAQCGGALRICGLTPECAEAFHECHLDSALPNHASRVEAVLGCDTAPVSQYSGPAARIAYDR
jgi:anti-anti-sigma regulatory factor